MLSKPISLLVAVCLGHSGPGLSVSAADDVPAPADSVLNLDAAIVSARVASATRSSLRVVDIPEEKIRARAVGNTFPEMIRNVPGVYSTSESGSFGDAKINIRGFKQENISILLNGIPISGLSSGSMYWNNWMGLAFSTASIQVQKGIGNSMLADNSVGGTINILTSRPSENLSSEAGYTQTGYGTSCVYFAVDSGILGRGWAFNLMGSHNWGRSYVERTDLSTWSYLATISKQIGARNKLELVALGSPEHHEQRSSRLTYAETEEFGVGYNKNWGWYVDEKGTKTPRTLSRNRYFKPYFTFSHTYDDRSGKDSSGVCIVNTLYAAYADGGGYYTESTGRRIASFLGSEGINRGHVDWNAVEDFNRGMAPDGNGIRAQNIMSDYLAGHVQAGLRSCVLFRIGKSLSFDAGLHYQLYRTWEKEMITNLLGADYWYEDYEGKSLAGMMGRNPVKKVGDLIRTDNGRHQHYGTVYAFGTFDPAGAGKTVVTLGVSAGGTVLRRWDLYNYVPEEKYSPWVSKASASVKAGVLQKLSRSSRIYANAAAYSRAPYANVFFSDGDNTVSRDVANEKNYLAELGYTLATGHLTLEATAYLAYWQDKSLLSNPYRSLDEDPSRYMIKGLDALHYGAELNASYRIASVARISAFASVGQWKWKNDVDAVIYDPYTMQPATTVRVYADGLHVGDAPQTQVGADVEVNVVKGLAVTMDWTYNDRFWADFDPATRMDPDDRRDSYRIPAYHLLNMGISYSGTIRRFSFMLFVNARNLTDALYIERSRDGASHDRDTFTGYWGNRRNFNFGLRISFR